MRGRVSERGGKFFVDWSARRTFRTREEAEHAAAMAVPPPRKTQASSELAAMVKLLHDGGIGFRTIAKALTWAEVPTARGGRWWPVTVKKLVHAATAEEQAQLDALREGAPDPPALLLRLAVEEPPILLSNVASAEDEARLSLWLRRDQSAARLLNAVADVLDEQAS